MFTVPPLSAVAPGPVMFTDVSRVVPPTAPPKVVVPVVFTWNANPPSSVLASVTAPPPVVSSTTLVPSVTASLNVWAPVVKKFAAFSAVVPPASVLIEVSAVPVPTSPLKVVVPLVFTASANAPLTVPASVTAPAPLDASVVPD